MKKYLFISALFFAIFLGGFLVFAQDDDPFADITYPVAELGDCTDKSDCLNFCDDPDNMEVCLDFADEHNLISEEDIEIGRKMLAAGETEGPGGCSGVAECGDYCDDISHLQECVAFAEEHDLMPPEELAEAKKVAEALSRGVQPPPCNSKTECDDVCRLPENMKVCIDFAKEAGLMPPEELEEAEMVLAALEKGITPPPCGGKDECDEYCSEPEHFEACITFAEAAGFMSAEEATMIRRTGGQGPGGCRGKDACEAFCEDPANMEPCINFAIENGFMSPEEAEQAKKMLAAGFTSGPGGCKGQDECESYCDDVSHMMECVDFAEQMGMMDPEDAARARKMAEMGITGGPGGCNSEEECRSFCDNPDNMETCLEFAVQIGDMSPEEAEEAMQGIQTMAQMKECLIMPCSEALACFQSLSSGEQPAEGEEPPEQGGGENDEIQAKIESCMQEMMPGEGMMPPEGFEFEEGEFEDGEIPIYDERLGGPPPVIPQGPSQEEIDRMMEEETQRKMQQIMEEEQQRIMQGEIDRMMEEQRRMIEQPQSFFEAVKNFLAGLVPTI